MKNFIKKYWSHILNIVFLLYCISILTFFANIKDNEITSIAIPIILIGIEAVLVIGVWIEIIYFMIKAIKNNEIKNKALSIVLIYLLNVFYIPCFALKHIYKDNKAKYKNAIYIIISILLYLLLTIVIFRFSLKEYNYTQYISDDNIISISVPSEYKNNMIVGEFDMYFRKNENFNIGIFLYDDTEKTAEEILEFQKIQLEQTRSNYEILDSDSINKNNKEITTCYAKGEYNNVQHYYYLATITFDEKKDYVVYIMGFSLEENNDVNRKEFEDILEKVKLN